MNSPSHPTDHPLTPSAGAEVSSEARSMAALGHALSFFEGGLVGPAILYFVKKDEDDFVAFHALQSLYFGLAFLALTVVSCGLLGVLLVIPYLVYEGVATVRAYEGKWYELPVVGRYARERHPGPAGSAPAPAAF